MDKKLIFMFVILVGVSEGLKCYDHRFTKDTFNATKAKEEQCSDQDQDVCVTST